MRVDCPHADRCAGCPAIHEDYAAQLEAKAARVAGAFVRFDALARVARAPVAPAVELEGYRTRAKLVVEGGRIGLYARTGGHEVVDLPGCRVLPPPLLALVARVRAALVEDSSLRRALVAVDVREVLAEEGPVAMATLVLDDAARFDATALAARLRRELPALRTVAISHRARRSPQILGRGLEVVSGDAEIDELVQAPGDRVVRVPAVPGGFVQAHRVQAARLRARLVERVREAGVAIEGARVVDAYAGSGALGLGLAAAGADVLAIDSHAPSVERARDAARRQGLALAAVAGDAAPALADLAARGVRADLVVLNPPRRGVAPEVRRAVAALAPRLVAYVSCDPDTLARDLDHLARLGWAARGVEPFDLIPLSREVETLAILAPAPPAPPRVVHREDEAVVVVKSAHEPTTPHPESPTSLLARVRAGLELPDATAVHRLDEGTSGLVLVARSPTLVPRWAAALAAGRKTYCALVRGVTRGKGVVRRALTIDGVAVPAVTRYRRLAVIGGHSLLAVVLETGRTHQIRRHLAGLGHPVLGDARHGHAPSNRHFEERLALDRPFLHAARLELVTPTGAALDLAAPLPGELRLVLDRLGGVPEHVRIPGEAP